MHDECCTCACEECVFFSSTPCTYHDDGKHRASAKMPEGENFDDSSTWAVNRYFPPWGDSPESD